MTLNDLWNLISSYLPSIRIYNDLDDADSDDGTASDDSYAYELPTHNYRPLRFHPSQTPPPILSQPAIQPADPFYPSDPYHPNYAASQPHGQYRDRIGDMWHPDSECEPPLAPGAGFSVLPEPARSRGFELWNAELTKKLKKLEDEMSEMQSESDTDREELRMLREANSELSQQNSQLHRELVEAYAWAQQSRRPPPPPASPIRPLDERDAELAALRSFHDKTDDITGTEVLQAVQDLNTEIMQLAAAASDEFPLSRQGGGLWTEADCELVRDAIGEGLLGMLRDGDHEEDPTVVQLAVQAWNVWSCRQVLDAFCVSMPPDTDRFMQAVFREMQLSESQPVTSRWRALTHKHARSISTSSIAPPVTFSYSDMGSSTSSALCSPIIMNPLPTPPSTTNNTPAPHVFLLPPPQKRTISTSSTSTTDSHVSASLRGLGAILALAGCTDPGARREPLRERFGEAVAHIVERTEKLARDVREGVSSAWFEVRAENAYVPPKGALDLRLRGLKGWAEDVDHESEDTGAKIFDPQVMQNMYAGYGNEVCGVLCTTAFGLEMVKTRRSLQEEEWGTQEDWHGAQIKGQQGAGSSGALERTLLLKPQVVLESVKDFLEQ